MDEPQEGMDTDNSIERIKTLNPLFKIRYSATHKVLSNLIYRLTPYDSYKQGLVKKIEVLTVSEKNDEASMKNENDIFDEVLLKNGFMLNYSKEKTNVFSKNEVYQTKDDFKECLICMDARISKETLKELESFKEKILSALNVHWIQR